jgi:hypothetical protein
MKAAVQLHELTEVRTPLSATGPRTALPDPGPLPRPYHPLSKGRARDHNPVLLFQLLRHQGWTEALARSLLRRAAVLFGDQLEDTLMLQPVP